MKKTTKKLALNTESVRALTVDDMGRVAGGDQPSFGPANSCITNCQTLKRQSCGDTCGATCFSVFASNCTMCL